MKRVLVITYYWPPSGGAGVQRWLKFTKYLPEFGWQPIVYTPENPEAPVDDPSLLEDIHDTTEVIKRPIWEPYTLYKRFVGMDSSERINAGFLKENERPEKKEGFSVWIRGNLFIPDARKFWIRPSYRFLRKYLKQHPVDAIISTGPPHSMHLIALKLKRHFSIPWIADFRDPWTEIDFYDQLMLTRRSDRKHKAQENAVLHGADRVVVIGKTMAERFRQTEHITPVVIPNGYDETDFTRTVEKPGMKEGPGIMEQRPKDPATGKLSAEFSIVHIGAMNRDRNIPIFWAALAELIKGYPELTSKLKIKLVGKLDISVYQSISEQNLEDRVEIEAHLPHDQVIPLLQSASVLYLPINDTPNAKSIKTGKIFEYLAAGRPVLGIGPEDGDAAEILKECQAGEMIPFGDKDKLKELLLNWLEKFQKRELTIKNIDTEKYSRRSLTANYIDLLNQLTQNR